MTSGSEDKTIKIWNMASGKCVCKTLFRTFKRCLSVLEKHSKAAN